MSTSFKLFGPTAADGYKMGHGPLYPNGTNFAYGNGTPRADRLFKGSKSQSYLWDSKVVWFGIQGVMREVHGLWHDSFFSKPKEQVIRRYARRMKNYLGEGMVDIEAMAALHDLGYLPVTILSVPEGSRLNMNVPGYVIYNTVPEFFWVVNYLETLMSSLIWKMVCNATIAYEYRRILEHFADLTGSPRDFVALQGHDFAFRGLSGPEDAARTGAGHLTSFVGTDTLPAIDYAEDMYFANSDVEFLAVSVRATEHAVATSNILYNMTKWLLEKGLTGGDLDPDAYGKAQLLAERQFILDAITVKCPTGIISLVCDSFDFWGVLTIVAPSLKEEILARQPDANGLAKVVFRPDSGDPVEVICGVEVHNSLEFSELVNNGKAKDVEYVLLNGMTYKATRYENPISAEDAEKYYTALGYLWAPVELNAEQIGAVECLWNTFGGTMTDKGFKVLHERVGLIYGDSITVERTQEIMRRLMKKGFASCNWVLGIGSYTYQHNTRDTFGYAIKATAVQVDDVFVELFKAPKTEGETNKKSAKGFLKVVKNEAGDFELLQEQKFEIADLDTHSGELRPIYKDGTFPNEVTFEEVRATLREAA